MNDVTKTQFWYMLAHIKDPQPVITTLDLSTWYATIHHIVVLLDFTDDAETVRQRLHTNDPDTVVAFLIQDERTRCIAVARMLYNTHRESKAEWEARLQKKVDKYKKWYEQRRWLQREISYGRRSPESLAIWRSPSEVRFKLRTN